MKIGYEWTYDHEWKYSDSCSKCGKLIPLNMCICHDKNYISPLCINCHNGSLYFHVMCKFPYILIAWCASFIDGNCISLIYYNNQVYDFIKNGNVLEMSKNTENIDDTITLKLLMIKEIYRDFILPKPVLSPKKYDVIFSFDW